MFDCARLVEVFEGLMWRKDDLSFVKALPHGQEPREAAIRHGATKVTPDRRRKRRAERKFSIQSLLPYLNFFLDMFARQVFRPAAVLRTVGSYF
jgi:hypothetical protein